MVLTDLSSTHPNDRGNVKHLSLHVDKFQNQEIVSVQYLLRLDMSAYPSTEVLRNRAVDGSLLSWYITVTLVFDELKAAASFALGEANSMVSGGEKSMPVNDVR